MNHHIVKGAWIQAAGTIVNAIDPPFVEDDGKVFAKTGNALQAMGNAIMADYSSEVISKLSNEIQATGNLFVFTGLFRDNINLEIQGNLIQAAGGGVGLMATITEKNLVEFQSHFLQATGNSIQAMSGILEATRNIDASLLDYTGAWVQAVGAVISAIHLTSTYRKDQKSPSNYYQFHFPSAPSPLLIYQKSDDLQTDLTKIEINQRIKLNSINA